MSPAWVALAGVLGLMFGSFANVVIYRMPRKPEFAGTVTSPGRSYCPSCRGSIAFYDNIPVLSYVALKGRCRNCRARIPVRYPLVELASGAAFVAAAMTADSDIRAALTAWFLWVLLVLSVIDGVGVPREEYADPYEGDGQADADEKDSLPVVHVLPDRLVLPSLAAALAFSAAGQLLTRLTFSDPWLPLVEGAREGLLAEPLIASIAGGLAGGGFLLALGLAWRGGMGGGDVKLAALVGVVLGPWVLMALFVGAALGAVVGLALMASGRRGRKDMVPFGPFIALGSVTTLFFGPQILSGYLRLVGLT